MALRISLALTVSVQAPFIFPTLKADAEGKDLYASRDDQGRPLIPQDQLRGVFREALGRVAAHDDGLVSKTEINHLFGQATGDALQDSADNEGSESQPLDLSDGGRSRVFFTDAICSDDQRRLGNEGDDFLPVTRVSLDEQTGAARDGHLLIIDQVAHHGEVVTFAATADLLITKDVAAKWESAFQAAATWVSALGGMKSAGFGKVTKLEVSRQACNSIAPRDTAPSPIADRDLDTPQHYRFTFDRPFLVDSHRIAANVYLGQEVVPGGVLKGGLARKLALAGVMVSSDPDLSTAFAALRVSHARPSGAPLPIPSSVYIGETEAGIEVHDDCDVETFQANAKRLRAIRFQADWKRKHRDQVIERLGYPKAENPGRDVRLHVALENGVATDGRLYEASAVVPSDHTWHVEIDYSRCGSEAARFAAFFESGLFGIGQTSAALKDLTNVTSEGSATKAPTFTNAVMLATDACLMLMGNAGLQWQKAKDARTFYERYWDKAANLKLKEFFARQDIAGGFVGRRFAPQGTYNPFLLTKAGSVFVFEGHEADIGQQLAGLAATGVGPIDSDQPHGKRNLNWRQCPYLGENGYGALVPLPRLMGSDRS